ncbi:MAG TPA: hypothetical protein VJ816_03855, partial [Gemmatimonadales bacterium]|nr:hypothetical protein [Gemmatimonadales bacterium]
SGAVQIPVSFYIHPCRVTPITIGDSATAALTAADCGAPHRDSSFARIFSFPGTANDSVSFEVPADFDVYVIVDTTLDGSRPVLAKTDEPYLYYQRLPISPSYYVEVTSAVPADTGVFTLRLTHPRLPAAPQAPDQRLNDSVTSVSPGATVTQSSILLRAIVEDPDFTDSLHLEAEVRPASIPFSGPNVPNGPPVRNGDTAWVSATGLADKTSYHWRVRAGDNTGRSGPWVSFGGNPDFVVNVPHAPRTPTALGQAKGDGTGILTGATTDTDVVILSGNVSDQDPGDALRIEVEVRPVGTPFSGSTDSSASVIDGGLLQAVVGPLPNVTSYHWRARARDQAGDSSSWVSYGGNLETATDFRIVTLVPNVPSALAQRQSGDQTSIPVGGAAEANTILITATVSDPDPNHLLQLEVEVEPVDLAFNGQPNYSSQFVANNATAQATIGPLSVNTGYHWQVRARSNAGRTSAWQSFPEPPGNPETDADFTYKLRPPPVQIVFTVQPTSSRAGSVIVPPVEVAALDSAGQVDIGFTGTVTMSIEPNIYRAKLQGTKTVSAVAGVARFSDLSVNKAGFGLRLRATTSQPSLTVLSAYFNISP